MTVLYVSPTGTTGGSGTLASPFASLQTAFDKATPGDTIYLRGGVYSFDGKSSGWSLFGHGGTSDAPIRIESYPGEKAILDGKGMALTPGSDNNWPSGRNANGAVLNVWDADHVQIRGIEIKNGPIAGVYANGHHDGLVLENLVVNGTGWLDNSFGTGIGIYGTGNDNKIINNDSYGNGVSQGGGNADGFQIFIKNNAVGTEISGNRAWRNADDGFDFYNVSSARESADGSRYLVKQNWSFENGFKADGSMNTNAEANGNGFKLAGRHDGATGTHGGHTVIDNIAWGNKSNGFDENSAKPGVLPFTVIGNTSFDNARNTDPSKGDLGHHYVFLRSSGTEFRDNLAFTSDGGRNSVLVQSPDGGALANSSDNGWNGSGSPSFTDRITAAEFASVVPTGIRGERGPDGSLPDIQFLDRASDASAPASGPVSELPQAQTPGSQGADQPGADAPGTAAGTDAEQAQAPTPDSAPAADPTVDDTPTGTVEGTGDSANPTAPAEAPVNVPEPPAQAPEPADPVEAPASGDAATPPAVEGESQPQTGAADDSDEASLPDAPIETPVNVPEPPAQAPEPADPVEAPASGDAATPPAVEGESQPQTGAADDSDEASLPDAPIQTPVNLPEPPEAQAPETADPVETPASGGSVTPPVTGGGSQPVQGGESSGEVAAGNGQGEPASGPAHRPGHHHSRDGAGQKHWYESHLIQDDKPLNYVSFSKLDASNSGAKFFGLMQAAKHAFNVDEAVLSFREHVTEDATSHVVADQHSADGSDSVGVPHPSVWGDYLF